MLKIAKLAFFKRNVKWDVANEEGHMQSFSFVAHFKHLGMREYKQMMQDVAAADAAYMQAKAEAKVGDALLDLQDGDALTLSRVLIGWDGVADAAGMPKSFSPEAVAELMDIMGARAATVSAYIAGQNGQREKN